MVQKIFLDLVPPYSFPVSQTVSWTCVYSLSIPGSSMLACPRMITEEAPTSQKNVKMGDETQSSGMPTTKRPMKRFFRVTTV
jgi:hypothetical protein